MIPLTLIKSDCYIAVAFDHSSLWWEKNVRIISTKETRDEAKKSARCMKANPANNFIVKREFVIIVDHIFPVFMLCFMLASGLLSSPFRQHGERATRQRCEKFVIPMIYLLCDFFSIHRCSISFLISPCRESTRLYFTHCCRAAVIFFSASTQNRVAKLLNFQAQILM